MNHLLTTIGCIVAAVLVGLIMDAVTIYKLRKKKMNKDLEEFVNCSR